jgi:hypothetical protein
MSEVEKFDQWLRKINSIHLCSREKMDRAFEIIRTNKTKQLTKHITQTIEQDGFSWFEYNMGAITLIEFSLSDLTKRIISIDPTLN